MSPESLQSSKNEKGYSGLIADYWSLGVSIYAFTFLELPFWHDNLVNLLENIKKKKLFL